MSVKFFDVELAYARDKNLKKDAVKALIKWVDGQPHLPKINEPQAILFLQKWKYQDEVARNAVDSYFTFKTLCSDIYQGKNPSKLPLTGVNFSCMTALPKTTPEGYHIIFLKFVNNTVDDFDFDFQLKNFDMVVTPHLHQQTTSRNYTIIMDLKDFSYEMLKKINPLKIKQFLYYVQELIPLNLKEIHYFNIPSFFDEGLLLIKPYLRNELASSVYGHQTLDDLVKHIPREYLPKDYGGPFDSVLVSLEKKKDLFLKISAFFEWEDKQIVDESKRPEKSKILENILAVIGSSQKGLASNFTSVNSEYAKNPKLKKSDVKEVLEWVSNQPHLPEINELQAIIFLQNWSYQTEVAKNAIDSYFTYKTFNSDMFLGRNPFNSSFKDALDICYFTVLPKKTSEGYSIIFGSMLNADMDHFNVFEQIKHFDMVLSLDLYQEGPNNGYIIACDIEKFPVEIMPKFAPQTLNRFFRYITEVSPIQIKGVHYFNTFPFIKNFVDLLRGVTKKEDGDWLHFHKNVEELTKYIPKDYLPKDYGGAVESTSVLREITKSKLFANAALFDWEDTQTVDETKRSHQHKTLKDILAIVTPYEFADLRDQSESEYTRDKHLKKQDVEELIDWVHDQPHLPDVNEAQAIRFLQRWYYQVESTKSAIDSYFTFKTFFADLFLGRNPLKSPLDTAPDVVTLNVLPKKTPEGYKILFGKMIDFDIDHFDFGDQLKHMDMVLMLDLHQEEHSKIFISIADMKDISHEAISKLSPFNVMRYLYYVQEVAPYQWQSIHIINAGSWIEAFLNLFRPNLRDNLQLYVHDTVDDLAKYVPKECLPRDYGGSAETLAVLQEKTKSKLIANAAFFDREDKQVVKESLRPNKYKAMRDILAIVQPLQNENFANGQNENFANGQNGSFFENGS